MRRHKTVLDWFANKDRKPHPGRTVLLWNGTTYVVGRVNEAGDIIVADGVFKAKRFCWAALENLSWERASQAFVDKLLQPPK